MTTGPRGTTFFGRPQHKAGSVRHPFVGLDRRVLLLIATSWFCITPAVPGIAQTRQERGVLTVVIDGLENDVGTVRIALSDSEENYYDFANPTIGASAPIQDGIARWQFPELPFGSYAVKAFHDEDDDGDLNTNFLGIPIEDYGFSNNASGLFGPPGWEDAHFQFQADTMTVRISFE